MRFIVPATAALLLAACASTPKPAPVAPTPVAEPPERGDLIGLNASELAARFGQPRLQVREGDSTKLQFRSETCVLDAYLYPPAGGGVKRVTHVDTRRPDGRDVAQPACLVALDARP